jgi:predicted signal transduction protein with EAL and GGDEF domain
LRDADLALYSAKAAGKDRHSLFEGGIYAGLEGRAELDAELANALRHAPGASYDAAERN